MKLTRLFSAVAAVVLTAAVQAGAKDGRLDITWVDVEGGAGTLIVTPQGESILIDTGMPGGRDPGRIHKAATEAGLKRIDHLIVTHFHIDHFGGAAEISKLIPIGNVWDNGIPDKNPDNNPSDTSYFLTIKPYRDFEAEKRQVIKPGTELPLKQSAQGPKLSLRCLATKQQTVAPQGLKGTGCETPKRKEKDPSDNANSVVMLLEFGNFQLFLGGDLTWNVEELLACPMNLAGVVDVYQVTHHGQDSSNNPLLVRALQPTVTVMSNGTTKGAGAETIATLKGTPSVEAMYQIHKNLREDTQSNTIPEHIANLEKNCQANPIRLSVAANAANYTVTIPGREHERTFQTK